MYWHGKILKMYTKISILDSKVKNQFAEQNVYCNIIFPKAQENKRHLYFHIYRLTCSYTHLTKGLEG